MLQRSISVLIALLVPLQMKGAVNAVSEKSLRRRELPTKKTSATEAASKRIEDAVEVGKKSVEQAMKASTESYEQTISMTKEQIEKASEALLNSYDEASALNKESIDAVVKAGEILTKGAETVGNAYYEITQASAEASVKATKAMMRAKTTKEFVEIQAEFTRTSFDSFLSESTRLSEMSVKVVNEAFEPLQKQLNTSFEKAFKAPAL